MRTRSVVSVKENSPEGLWDGEARTGVWSEEITVKMFKFRHSSRVCRRTFGSRNALHTIPENEVIEFKNIVRSPVLNLRPASIAKLTPASKATAVGPAASAGRGVDSKVVQGEKAKKPGFWKAFKLRPGSSRRTKNHHVDAASLLSFV